MLNCSFYINSTVWGLLRSLLSLLKIHLFNKNDNKNSNSVKYYYN